ncbi:MAG: YihA family ribosome biogenesis GTP-binding protein [Selenomonadaceae bacterium]|nr:YihA family ribosome biogenesis GTP-binding protein [Selenomonadaceae bacterium]
MEKIVITKATYLTSAVNKSQYPENSLSEVAFLGRSNVGKSSLINSVANMKSLARVSAEPGKTRTINFYEFGLKKEEERKSFCMVDLPGYGYAKIGRESRKVWAKFTEEYLLTQERLAFLCLLIDIRHDPTALDIGMFNFLTEHNIPVLIVATKSDKLSKNAAKKQLCRISDILNVDESSVLPFSSMKKDGRDELLTVIWESLNQGE